MHEVSIVEALIEQIEREVSRIGAPGPVTRLELEIGRLSGVNVDSVRFAFELLSPGTMVEKAEMLVDEPKAVCVCRGCGRWTEIDELAFECPACGSPQITVEGGDQMMLKAIELEE